MLLMRELQILKDKDINGLSNVDIKAITDQIIDLENKKDTLEHTKNTHKAKLDTLHDTIKLEQAAVQAPIDLILQKKRQAAEPYQKQVKRFGN